MGSSNVSSSSKSSWLLSNDSGNTETYSSSSHSKGRVYFYSKNDGEFNKAEKRYINEIVTILCRKTCFSDLGDNSITIVIPASLTDANDRSSKIFHLTLSSNRFDLAERPSTVSPALKILDKALEIYHSEQKIWPPKTEEESVEAAEEESNSSYSVGTLLIDIFTSFFSTKKTLNS